MSGDRPLVSVVVPVYDERDLLEGALETVTAQSYARVETVVVADSPEERFDDIVDKTDDATLVKHDENEGAGAARNTGIEASEGQYVAFLDVDDRWDSTKLEKQVQRFRECGDEVGLVYTGFTQFELDGSAWDHYPAWRGNVFRAQLERDRIHPTSTVMVRRTCLDRVGDFDESLPSRQDYDLWLRITEHYRVEYVNELLVEKYERESNISKDFDARVAGDRAVLRKVRQRLPEYGPLTRSKVLSYHYHVLGRDHDSNGDRRAAVYYLLVAILRYPPRPVSWLMLLIVLLGIDRRSERFVATKRRLLG